MKAFKPKEPTDIFTSRLYFIPLIHLLFAAQHHSRIQLVLSDFVFLLHYPSLLG